MHRSGLALSGAAAALAGPPDPDRDDGIVTAEEVGGLDLWGTRLVVLSACDTGLGEIYSGEGVLGLRRAFVQAGTQNLMLTLWRVEDAFTRDLMLDFYHEFLETNDAVAALTRVQRQRLETNADPRFWAPFLVSVQGSDEKSLPARRR
jgi:CHAT domain-containing protein